MSVSEPSADVPPLRERKRAQTRERIIAVGVELFGSKGYDETTVADIAAAAEIGTRTFFAYFEGKEALLFGPGLDRTDIAVGTIAAAAPDDDPARVLLRCLDAAADATRDDFLSERALLRLRLVDSVAAVRARGAAEQLDAIDVISDALAARFPKLGAAKAAGIAGAFVGASAAAVKSALQHADSAAPAQLQRRIRSAVAAGLGVKE
ncbi:TetR/AcrR family transcriptional regulator [Rathayibacter sp. CAU 1779]